jgi:hypothetical protein
MAHSSFPATPPDQKGRTHPAREGRRFYGSYTKEVELSPTIAKREIEARTPAKNERSTNRMFLPLDFSVGIFFLSESFCLLSCSWATILAVIYLATATRRKYSLTPKVPVMFTPCYLAANRFMFWSG